MVKATHKGLRNLDDPAYKQGYSVNLDPQLKKPSETPTKDTPQPSEEKEK
jgi:hypothetical protein